MSFAKNSRKYSVRMTRITRHGLIPISHDELTLVKLFMHVSRGEVGTVTVQNWELRKGVSFRRLINMMEGKKEKSRELAT